MWRTRPIRRASAISSAVTAGTKTLRRVYVTSSLPGLVWPCGGCRQRIFEFACEGCEVVALGLDGEVGRQTIEQLLPLGFRLDPSQVNPH
jgi:cytidine deaminase